MAAHQVRNLISQARQLRGGRRAGAAQARLVLRLLDILLLHAVEPQQVKVDIQVEPAAEALHQRYSPAPRAGAVNARLSHQPSCDHAMHDAEHRPDGVRLAVEQEAQWVRETQHLLPHRPRAKHRLHQVPRTLGLAPRATTRADAALLAGERQQQFRMALLAYHAQEAVLAHAAAQERQDLLAHIRRQRAGLHLKTPNEIQVVRLHQRAQERALGRMASTARRGHQRSRLGADAALRCGPLRHGEAQHGTLLYSDGSTVFHPASSPLTGVCPVHG